MMSGFDGCMRVGKSLLLVNEIAKVTGGYTSAETVRGNRIFIKRQA